MFTLHGVFSIRTLEWNVIVSLCGLFCKWAWKERKYVTIPDFQFMQPPFNLN